MGIGWSRPWWEVRGVPYPGKDLLEGLGAPFENPWDLTAVLGAIRECGLPLSAISVTYESLEYAIDAIGWADRGSPRRTVVYRRWAAAPKATLYRALSTSEQRHDLRRLDQLAVWLACSLATDGKLTDTMYRNAFLAKVRSASGALAHFLESPPSDEARQGLARLATMISPKPDFKTAVHAARSLAHEHVSHKAGFDAVAESLLLLEEFGHRLCPSLYPSPFSRPTSPAEAQLQHDQSTPQPQSAEKSLSSRKPVVLQRSATLPDGSSSRAASKQYGTPSVIVRGNDRERRRQSHVQAPLRAPTSAELRQLAEEGDAVEDAFPQAEGVASEVAPSGRSEDKARAHAVRFRAAVRHGFWAREQWDATTRAETRAVVGQLLFRRESADPLLRSAIALGLLCGCTGFSIDRAHAIRLSTCAENSEDGDLIDIESGVLTMRLPGEEVRFKPTSCQEGFLVRVADRVKISLPSDVQDALAALSRASECAYVFEAEKGALESSLAGFLAKERPAEERVSVARFIRAHGLECLAITGDVALSQLVCGDPLGASTVPIAYYAAQMTTIQTAYNSVVEAHGYKPAQTPAPPPERVGSRLQMTEAAARAVSSSVMRGLIQKPRNERLEGRGLLRVHSEAVGALGVLLLAATGARATFRAVELRSDALCLFAGLAVISDKIADASHIARLIPICPVAVQSLSAYGLLLESISEERSIPRAIRHRARAALAGKLPLLFIVSGGESRNLTNQDLSDCMPVNWPLPLNMFRHRLATRLREVGCPGCFVQAFLGHIEVGIQPFGSESFMDPITYLSEVGRAVQKVLECDGWKPLLGGAGDLDVFARHCAPIGPSVTGLISRLNAETEAEFASAQAAVEALRESDAERIAALVEQRFRSACPDLSLPKGASKEFDSIAVSALRELVTEDADSLAEMEVRVESLSRLLSRGKEDNGWRVRRLPKFRHMQPTPSVFRSELVAPYSALLLIRSRFIQKLKRPKGDSTKPSIERLVLALVLWHGVADRERLRRLIEGVPRAISLDYKLDGLLVPTLLPEDAGGRRPEAVELLRGPVALCAHAFQHQDAATVSLDSLEAPIKDWLGTDIVNPGKLGFIDLLLALARIGHYFEAPPPLRMAWTGEVESVSMPLDRALALLGNAQQVGTRDELAPAEESPPIFPNEEPPRAKGWEQRAHRWLRATLHFKRHARKEFPIEQRMFSGEMKMTKARRQTAAAIRSETIERIEARLARWPDDETMVRRFHQYALHCLQNGTPFNPVIEQETVYKYVVGVSKPILTHMTDESTSSFDADDYRELYESCIDASPPKHQTNVADYIAYFHGFLFRKGIAPAVAISRRSSGRCYPNVGYVAPQEISEAIRILRAVAARQQSSLSLPNVASAASNATALGFASGARVAEILLSQVRDVVWTPENRALLVRRNPLKRVKTFRGTRVLNLDRTMPDEASRRIEDWLIATSALKIQRERHDCALFPELGSVRPIPPSKVTSLLSQALKKATGSAGASATWWRHTVASNEMLDLFAPEVTALVNTVVASDDVWTPSAYAIRSAIGDLPLCQAHAAMYRARRGHYRMFTSLESYVHVIGLIEAHSSKIAASEMSTLALAWLGELSHTVLRKRLSRALVSSSDTRQAIRTLIASPPLADASLGRDADTWDKPGEEESGDTGLMVSLALKALRAGSLDPWFAALRLSPERSEAWKSRFLAAIEKSNYGISLPAVERSGVRSSDSALTMTRNCIQVEFDRLDAKWILDRVQHTRERDGVAAVWSRVLQEIDPRTGCISARNFEDLRRLNDDFFILVAKEPSNYSVVPVVCAPNDPTTGMIDEDWQKMCNMLGAEPIVEPTFTPLPGRIGIGLQVRTRGPKSRRVIKTMIAAALMAVVFQERAPAP